MAALDKKTNEMLIKNAQEYGRSVQDDGEAGVRQLYPDRDS